MWTLIITIVMSSGYTSTVTREGISEKECIDKGKAELEYYKHVGMTDVEYECKKGKQ